MNLAPLTSRIVALSVVSLITASASASVFTLTFEGLDNTADVGNFYNGGAGGSYGVEFLDAQALIAGSAGGSGNFTNAPSMPTIMFFRSASSAVMNVAAGFQSGFSTYYTSATNSGSVSLYSGLDGTGAVLATLNLVALGSDNTPDATFDRWALVGATFVGTAKSVVFSGDPSQIGFDNVTFGSSVPAPGAIALLGAVGLAGSRRRRA